ncbi:MULTISPECIES: hypothetical protein [unclassified Mesotoga]|jgi:hypothetical protein|uniref:Uncharacterized protein n=1 Tax=Mesotoga prima TaxID=1184387 RepID=A0A101HS95_9BACT|nr:MULTISPECIES: hypothetical protein [unclassified Mesotoga]KUK82088.1 MAG: Uncharacterized protein XD94_0181 [Mesotoga prima]PXF34506.1 hypothetical protein EU77_07090 [Mesotoga sp. SC_NapDC]RAM60210.1 hypothetical protein DS66_07540 [Mesotoga sp. SC_3PWM13N19]MDD3461331.1 hypothetical protein [Mesotoga sp.]PNS40147.1 hypothetical protein RJ60_06820 [Mesotoga sp. B105.6.4]
MSFKDLLDNGPKVVNLGMERFYLDLQDQEVPAVKVNWRPPLAKSSLMDKLRKLRGEEVE